MTMTRTSPHRGAAGVGAPHPGVAATGRRRGELSAGSAAAPPARSRAHDLRRGADRRLPRPPPAAAAVGKLAPTRLHAAPGTRRRCDLYADDRHRPAPRATRIPIWGFASTDAAGSAHRPGPGARRHPGRHRHHHRAQPALPAERLAGASRARPATSARPATTRHRRRHRRHDDVHLHAPRAPAPSSTRPGTPPTAPARSPWAWPARSSCCSTDGTAYGTPAASAYDDEAVLVLSEIDPALNADPDDVRHAQLQPAYRLINGKPFPETDADRDRPGPQGAAALRQRRVADPPDDHARRRPAARSPTTATRWPTPRRRGRPRTSSPAQTVDTLVTMPTGPEAKLTLYEPAQPPRQQRPAHRRPAADAFGGMMTFLDTARPAAQHRRRRPGVDARRALAQPVRRAVAR